MIDYNELEKLKDLKEKGIITEEEFQRKKEEILSSSGTKAKTGTSSVSIGDLFKFDKETWLLEKYPKLFYFLSLILTEALLLVLFIYSMVGLSPLLSGLSRGYIGGESVLLYIIILIFFIVLILYAPIKIRRKYETWLILFKLKNKLDNKE
jgi:hypothetical protein